MKKNLIISVIALICFHLNAQEKHHLEFALKGIQFDSLRIAAYDYSKQESIMFWNTLNNNEVWAFEMPDSIWNMNRLFVLGKSNNKNRYEYIRFYKASDTMSPKKIQSLSFHIFPDESDIKIEATYTNSDTVQDGSVMLVYHNFALNPQKTSGIEGMMRCPDFSSFDTSTNDNSNTYKDQLKVYIQAVNDCPNSRFLAIKLLDNINRYHSSSDVWAVYDCFSANIKKSKYGMSISNALSKEWTRFENVFLRNVITGQNEIITNENKKFSLLCFTASWCVNCRKEVPLLKEIYNDLKDFSFEIIYVSVDKGEQQESEFRKQIIADSIPWRSLFSYPLKIEDKYLIKSIPTDMLVYPDKHTEFLDVREKAKREKLYRLVKE